MSIQTRTIFVLLLFLSYVNVALTQASDKEYGVYEYVVRNAQGGFEQSAAKLDSSVVKNGWTLLAKIDAGVPENCSYKARVFVVVDTVYAKSLMQINFKTAPFAIVDRINLFEDEQGLHVSVVNPRSIIRTVMMKDTTFETIAQNHLHALRLIISSCLQGEETHKQYGEMRNEGFIGKTMGVMAGGRFDNKVEDAFVLTKGSWISAATEVSNGLRKPGPKWGLHQVYRLDLPEFKTVVFGVTGSLKDTVC